MHVSLISWVALGAGAACFGVGLAMGLLVVWQSYRNVENVLAGLFNVTVILWGCNVFMIYLIGTTTGEVPKALRLAAPVPAALNSLVFFALATRAAGAWQAR